jgi:tripartite-type tricarboxylate transporter receptor subunit TctC
MTGTDILRVPYKGSAQAITDLMAGNVSVMWDNLPASMPYIKAGRLRAIAITSAQRYPAFLELPTVAESGVPGYEASAWFRVVVPAATPREVIARLNNEINRAVNLPDMKERFAQQGATLRPARRKTSPPGSAPRSPSGGR